MKKFTICIDIDDTVHNLTKAWAEWLEKEYHLNVDYKDITDWDMSLFYPELTLEQICKPLEIPEFWDSVEAYKDAVTYIKYLIEDGHDVYFCTSTDYRTAPFKFKRTNEKYFPFIDKNHIILTYNKKIVNCDFLIDDGYHNMYGTYVGLLFTTPANTKIKVAGDSKVIRVHIWEEIYYLIKNYQASN